MLGVPTPAGPASAVIAGMQDLPIRVEEGPSFNRPLDAP
jgi:hypothetical protein